MPENHPGRLFLKVKEIKRLAYPPVISLFGFCNSREVLI
jgi:hypothetical protein